jgi:hypothetical protein
VLRQHRHSTTTTPSTRGRSSPAAALARHCPSAALARSARLRHAFIARHRSGNVRHNSRSLMPIDVSGMVRTRLDCLGPLRAHEGWSLVFSLNKAVIYHRLAPLLEKAPGPVVAGRASPFRSHPPAIAPHRPLHRLRKRSSLPRRFARSIPAVAHSLRAPSRRRERPSLSPYRRPQPHRSSRDYQRRCDPVRDAWRRSNSQRGYSVPASGGHASVTLAEDVTLHPRCDFCGPLVIVIILYFLFLSF